MIRTLVSAAVVSLVMQVALAGHLKLETSPASFELVAEGDANITLGIVAMDKLVNPHLNGIALAGTMPTESAIIFKPNGRAIFAYSDLFLREFRGRDQVLNSKDAHGRPAEDFLHFPKDAKLPKFLRDIWKVNATHLCMNWREDILWWTGELIYRFDFAFPVISLKLESTSGKRTTVGDWEWEKVGRAVKIFASTDGENWTLIWQSHGKGGRTAVDAQLPPDMKGAKTVFIKFWGQNANVLFDLYVTAELEARDASSLLKLQKGINRFEFRDAPESSHRAFVFWEGKGVKAKRAPRRFTYPRKRTTVKVSDDEIEIRFPEG
ncbi:MAG TPA: hypothetical protein EYP10_08550, partial [Armatimonadetes bacterium]|nr:hypothetical protein [Armatimonadota bacterium]